MPLVYDMKLLANTVIYRNENLNSDIDTFAKLPEIFDKSDSIQKQAFSSTIVCKLRRWKHTILLFK